MTELAIPVSTLNEKKEYSQAIAQSDLLPPAFRGKPQNVLLAIDIAQSLGRSPIEIMQQAAVIGGKLTLSAEFMRSLVLGSGHVIRVFMDGETAVAQGIRADDPTFTHEVRWDLARAKTAGLSGGNYSKFPQAMLKARATTELCRDAFADVIHGVRSTEESFDIPESPAPSRLQAAVAAKVAETITPEPETVDVTDAVEMISERQMKALHARFGEKGITEREDKLASCSSILKRDVESTKDLTADEARTVYEYLRAQS